MSVCRHELGGSTPPQPPDNSNPAFKGKEGNGDGTGREGENREEIIEQVEETIQRLTCTGCVERLFCLSEHKEAASDVQLHIVL